MILGPEVMDVAQGSSFALSIQLQQGSGEAAKSKCLQVTLRVQEGGRASGLRPRCHARLLVPGHSGDCSQVLTTRALQWGAG